MPKKVNNYENERILIMNKIFEILGINNDKNKIFSLHKLDADIEKQNQILALEDDIKKYFLCGRWTCFNKTNVKRKWLSMIKYVAKDTNFNITSSNMVSKSDEYLHKGTIYIFTIKN